MLTTVPPPPRAGAMLVMIPGSSVVKAPSIMTIAPVFEVITRSTLSAILARGSAIANNIMTPINKKQMDKSR